jgi:hypothetical protein
VGVPQYAAKFAFIIGSTAGLFPEAPATGSLHFSGLFTALSLPFSAGENSHSFS